MSAEASLSFPSPCPARRWVGGVHTHHEGFANAGGELGQAITKVLEPHQVGGPMKPFWAGTLPDKGSGAGTLTVGPSGKLLAYCAASGAARQLPIVNGAIEGLRRGGAPPPFSPVARSQVFGEISIARHCPIWGDSFFPQMGQTLHSEKIANLGGPYHPLREGQGLLTLL